MPPLLIGAAMTTAAALIAVTTVAIVKWASDAFSMSFLITLRWCLGFATAALLLIGRDVAGRLPEEMRVRDLEQTLYDDDGLPR